jgi:F0F1-type ATP synthase assembly protein I
MPQGYRARIALSLLMVVAEAIGGVVVPFVIGVAIDDYLDGSYRGLIVLASVGLATMLLATLRRLHDVRASMSRSAPRPSSRRPVCLPSRLD